MTRALVTVLMAMGAVTALGWWHVRRAQRRAAERVAAMIGEPIEAGGAPKPVRSFPLRYRYAAPVAGAIVAVVAWSLVHLPMGVSAATGLLLGVLVHMVEDYAAEQRAATIEAQLALAIDLLVGSLRSGASLLAAFEAALQESDPPLRFYLQEVAGRIRLGDDPRVAIDELQTQVPLETFRLFSTSLAIHWEVGGSLATTLTTVGRTVRDRIELSRRVRAQGVESNASVAVVLMIAYVLAFLMWRTSPDRLEAFVMTGTGTTLVAGVISLQAVGLVWMSRLSRSGF